MKDKMTKFEKRLDEIDIKLNILLGIISDIQSKPTKKQEIIFYEKPNYLVRS